MDIINRIYKICLIYDEKEDFKSRKGGIDAIFILRHIGEKTLKKKQVYIGFMDFIIVAREALSSAENVSFSICSYCYCVTLA